MIVKFLADWLCSYPSGYSMTFFLENFLVKLLRNCGLIWKFCACALMLVSLFACSGEFCLWKRFEALPPNIDWLLARSSSNTKSFSSSVRSSSSEILLMTEWRLLSCVSTFSR